MMPSSIYSTALTKLLACVLTSHQDTGQEDIKLTTECMSAKMDLNVTTRHILHEHLFNFN